MKDVVLRKRTWGVPLCGWLCLALMLPCGALAQQSRAGERSGPATQSEPAARSRAAERAPPQRIAPEQPAAQAKPVARAKRARPGPKAAARAPGKAMDRLELGTTDITGNRELPKVMSIVPWKHSELGDLTGKPLNSLVDQTLQPVDRDVFRRENDYYRAVTGAHGASGGAANDAARSAGGDGRRGARDER